MASVLTPPKPKASPIRPGADGGPPRDPGFGGGDGWGGGPDDGALAIRRYKTGMWLGLGAIVMVFSAFTSAYVVRKGMSNDWRAIRVPSILWLNTAVLLASSLTFERAKREREALSWLNATAALGTIFVVGQFLAWLQLRASGVFLASNPSSSFFYLLTGAHALHIAGGILALFYVVFRIWRGRAWPRRQAAVEATALYWHFMDGLWVYIFLLLLVGR